jgi:hypothetical protein
MNVSPVSNRIVVFPVPPVRPVAAVTAGEDAAAPEAVSDAAASAPSGAARAAARPPGLGSLLDIRV